MASPIGSLLRKATRKQNDKLNILTFPTHERYESSLCLTGHNFYGFHGEGIKSWNKKYAPIPKNYTLLDGNKGSEQLLIDVDFDLVLSQNKFAHFNIGSQIAGGLNIPLVTLEHCVPSRHWHPQAFQQARMMQGDINVLISKYSIDAWQLDKNINYKIIYHGIDTNIFNFDPLQNRDIPVLNVCNDMPNRPLEVGWELWCQVSQMLPNTLRLVGENGKFSKAAENTDELVKEYRRAKIFLNTTLVSTYPTSMLEAMACGCVVITPGTCAIPQIITHGVNGIIANTAQDIVKYIIELNKNPEYMAFIQKNALETIKKMFALDRFINEWNTVFNEALEL